MASYAVSWACAWGMVASTARMAASASRNALPVPAGKFRDLSFISTPFGVLKTCLFTDDLDDPVWRDLAANLAVADHDGRQFGDTPPARQIARAGKAANVNLP